MQSYSDTSSSNFQTDLEVNGKLTEVYLIGGALYFGTGKGALNKLPPPNPNPDPTDKTDPLAPRNELENYVESTYVVVGKDILL